MATYTIATTTEQETALTLIASKNGKGLTNTQYLTGIIISVLDNYVTQTKDEAAKSRLNLYDTLDTKDKGDVDAIFAKAQAAKEAEEKPVAEAPLEELKEG